MLERLLLRLVPARWGDSIEGDLEEARRSRRAAGRRAGTLWFVAAAARLLAWLVVEECRARVADGRASSRRTPLVETFFTQLRRAWKRLAYDWRFSLAVVLILAAGIGPAAAMTSVFYDVLLKPLAYHEPERLGMVRIDIGELKGHAGLSPAEAIDLRRSGIFDAVEVETRVAEISLDRNGSLVSLTTLNVTTGMLSMLGVTPALGRGLAERDILVPAPRPAGAPPSGQPPPLPPLKVMLDYGAWRTHFGGDRHVIGRLISLNGRSSEIVGVLPEGFRLVTGRSVPQPIDVYAPLRLTDFRNSWMFPTLVRLKPGSTFEQAQAALDVLAPVIKSTNPAFYDGDLRYTVTPLLADITRTSKPALTAAVAAVLLLLVIAFANATALVVARLKTREVDLAIRTAIGATPRALVAEALTESTLLACGGALVGSLLAVATLAGVQAAMPRTVPRWDQIAIGWSVVGYATILSFAGLLVSCLTPVWRVCRGRTWHAIRSGSAHGGRAEGAASRLVLVGGQIAFTVVLGFGCAQLLRSAANLRNVDLGYEPSVLSLRVPFDFARYNSRAKRAELYQRIRDRVREVPGVVAAGVVTHLPLSGQTMMDGYEADLSVEPSFRQSANYQAVSPGYFAAMRIPIVRGRDFTDAEDAQMQPVIVVDDSLVRTVFPGQQDVIGRELRLGWGLANARIVGVVRHARTIDVGREVRPQIYVPIGNLFQNAGTVIVRTSGNPMASRAAIERAIRDAGPGRAVSNVRLLSENVSAAMSTTIAVTRLLTFLAVIAAALSAAGLYLVVAFVVNGRRRSTAIRTALGASPRQVMWTNCRTTGGVLLAAVPLGALLSLAAAPMFADLLYEVSSRDPASLCAAIAAAAVIGLAGTYVPIRRAARIEVVKVLRET